MIELVFTVAEWLGLAVFFYLACLVIRCAAEEIRTVPANLSPLATHDWDASDRAARNAQRLEAL